MQQKDLAKILELARSVAEEIHPEDTAGALRGFRAELHRPRRLQNWLERRAVARLLSKPGSPPLYTPDQFLLLFDPDERGWLHRSLLLVGVVQKLHELGWNPEDGREQASEVVAEPESLDVAGLSAEDVEFVDGVKE